MSFMPLLVIVCGLVFGYWGVSWLFRNRTPPDAAAGPETAHRPRAAPEAPAVQRWYQVLGVAPSASTDEIRTAYRQLMSQYHPDKVSSLGVELQALAERKTKEIGAAYREGMNASGVSV